MLQKEGSIVGTIKPELYQPDLVHQASVESSGPSEVECGKLHFTLRYDPDVEGLFVKVIHLFINSILSILLNSNYANTVKPRYT